MAEPREMQSRDARSDSPARFLHELRQLRGQAGLDLAELAARAHYPCDVIKAAEAGPSLPDLPVLSAYVRGCGGTPAEWEERWRAVTGSPASPLLTTRGTGWSEAADAGARVGAASAAGDGHDPDHVMAALNRVADRMAAAASSSSAASGGAASGGAVSDLPAGDPAASDEWDFASAAGEQLWASVPDPAPASASVWEPAPKMPSARDSAAPADRVWDSAPAMDHPLWDPAPAVHPVWDHAPAPGSAPDPATPAASAWDRVPQAREARYAGTVAVPRDSATSAPGAADRSQPTVPSGSSPQRTLPSWRVFAALLTVVLIVVATMLALST